MESAARARGASLIVGIHVASTHGRAAAALARWGAYVGALPPVGWSYIAPNVNIFNRGRVCSEAEPYM